MAACPWCRAEMLTVDGCRENDAVRYPDGSELPSIAYENAHVLPDDRPAHRCHDCGVRLGQKHHPGCDMEDCPRCGGQLISCGCLDAAEEETS